MVMVCHSGETLVTLTKISRFKENEPQSYSCQTTHTHYTHTGREREISLFSKELLHLSSRQGQIGDVQSHKSIQKWGQGECALCPASLLEGLVWGILRNSTTPKHQLLYTKLLPTGFHCVPTNSPRKGQSIRDHGEWTEYKQNWPQALLAGRS